MEQRGRAPAAQARDGAVVAFAPRRQNPGPRALEPRRKLLERGAQSLSTSELLELIAGSTQGNTAGRLLRRYGLHGLRHLGPAEWQAEHGVGPVCAARLCAVFELGRRSWSDEHEERPRIQRPVDAYRRVGRLRRLKKEHLVGLYLDAQNGLIHEETISIGSLNTTRTHPREILYPAIVHLAAGFILAHNHPSGTLEPSPEDVEFTRAVHRAGELVGIELYDHLVVSVRGYVSLRERGLL